MKVGGGAHNDTVDRIVLHAIKDVFTFSPLIADAKK